MQVLKAEVRLDILNAARELFFELGFEGATMRQVANRIAMSTSNLYKYFRNKDDLFEAVVGSYASSFRRGLELSLSHREEEEFDRRRIKAMAAELAKAIGTDPKAFHILMSRSQGSAYEAYKNRCAAALERHLLDAMSRSIRSEFLVRIVVTNLLAAFSAIALEYGGTVLLEEQMQAIFRYHMAGFKALRS